MKKEIISGLKWDLLGKVGNQSVGFIISIVLARILSPADFGLLAMTVAFSALANGFGNFGFTSALIQKKKIGIIETSSVFFLNVFMGIILAIVFFLSADAIGNYYDNLEVTKVAKVLSLSFIFNSFGLVSLALLEKKLDFKSTMKVGLLSGIGSGIIGLSMAYIGFGIWSLVISSLANELLRTIAAIKLAKFRPRFFFSRKALAPLWRYGSKLFVSGFFNSAFSKADYLIIGKFFPAALLGLYYRAQSFRTLILRYTSDSLGKVFFPVFSNKQNDLAWVKNTIEKSIIISVFFAAFFIGGIYVVSNEFFILLFSEKWVGAVPYFKVLIISGVTFPIVSILSHALNGLGESNKFLKNDFIEKIGLLGSIFSAVYFHDFMLYLYLDVVARYMSAVFFLLTIKKMLSIDLKNLTYFFFFIGLSSIISVIVTAKIWFYLNIHSLFLALIIKGILYVFLFAFFVFLEKLFNKNSTYLKISSMLMKMNK